ncbi:recombinase family protein [Burkholderia stagnalis]|uniref:recombinase family protein n=1 Tax=Burkholderia stagnalis TaxID=1503054 RepID=UPI000F5CA2AB|nr:recombinase family protein [Burkholderia stagnalis]RQY95006.1 recombinase family protein [Burkholderia stagnalis]RQZ02686.1 recombinase family protein [Burkholderia stagnalis]
MDIGYARVSTDEQHLDLQLAALEGYRCDAIYSDQGVSGASIDRPGLSSAMTALTRGGTLVVWRLDRLGRSIRHLIDVIAWLNDNGVRLVSLTECIDTQSPTGRFTFHMIAALAEFERSLISERTRAGLQGARLRGSRLGRPPALDATQCARAQELLRTQSEAEVAEMFDIHIRTLRRHLTRYAQRHQ